MENTEGLCLICYQPSQGHHFSVQCCIACASFFRRSICGIRTYKCHRNENCNMQSKCRKCRLLKCFKVGMRPELVQNRPIQKDGESTLSGNISQLIPLYSDPIDKLNRGLLDYNNQQRFLFTLLYPEKDPNQLHLVSYDENILMIKGCMSLIFNVMSDHFSGFSELEIPLKISVFRAFAIHFSMFFQNFQTVKTFKDSSNRFFLLHHGQLADCQRIDLFHKNDPNPHLSMKQSMEVAKFCVPLVDKMRELNIRSCEIAALLAIRLWNEVENQSLQTKDLAETQRQRIYKSLYDDIERNYNSPMAGPRFGNLMLLLVYLEPIVTQLLKNDAMDRIFDLYNTRLPYDYWVGN